jgi:hypothetical protein
LILKIEKTESIHHNDTRFLLYELFDTLLSETKGIVKNGDSFFVQEGKKELKVEPS